MPFDKTKYHPKWDTISRFIRFYRAKNKCEWCGVPNGVVIIRNEAGWMIAPDECQLWNWKAIKEANRGEGNSRFTKIVLTTAHIDQDKNNNSFFNLAALCQSCHLGHDRHQHARNRRFGRYHKERQMTIQFP